MSGPGRSQTSYADAGVSIERGDELVERIKKHARRTARPGVLAGIGGFASLFDLSKTGYRDPVLVSGTDGVGTKIKLAAETGRHHGIGIDLVGMCVNDLVVQGAEPLFFLDYYACGGLDVDVAERVVSGIAEGCRIAGCALVGGETAEMPGVYRPGDYDLAGFAVGIVERKEIIDGSGIRSGDVLIGLASSGPHSNGYSLIRTILSDSRTALDARFGEGTIGDILLEPTRIYVRSILDLRRKIPIKGIAHITGGGITENLPRILAPTLAAEIHCDAWKWPEVFHWLQRTGNVDMEEMYRTFNCGVGMILVTQRGDSDAALELLADCGEQPFILGRIVPYGRSGSRVLFRDRPSG